MEYEIYEAGHLWLPNFVFTNEAGTRLFVSVDVDPEWRGRPRPEGRYISTAWIPGNFLTEGMVFVGLTLMTIEPECTHVDQSDLLAFRVVDCLTADDTARGDFKRPMPGVVRPLLEWHTRYSKPDGKPASLRPSVTGHAS
jgi:lipopolysaccharide transport system ATP-binding protein